MDFNQQEIVYLISKVVSEIDEMLDDFEDSGVLVTFNYFIGMTVFKVRVTTLERLEQLIILQKKLIDLVEDESLYKACMWDLGVNKDNLYSLTSNENSPDKDDLEKEE